MWADRRVLLDAVIGVIGDRRWRLSEQRNAGSGCALATRKQQHHNQHADP
jgi:hypothetical protein